MKTPRLILITVWVLMSYANTLMAQVFTVKTYKMSIKGTSSMHDWESSVGTLEAKGSFALSGSTLDQLRDVVVKIPVKSIKSPKGKIMDSKTWDAFGDEKNPLITFALADMKITPIKNTVALRGSLSMAGVTRPVELSINYKVLADGELLITGTKKLVMSEFKMEPPTAMMGAIKVGDEVEVAFEIVLSSNNTL